jgi:hypothetical protein
MKSIDAEIFAVEQRLHMREASLRRNAEALKHRSLKVLMSPVAIAGAVALGFVVSGAVGRKKKAQPAPFWGRLTRREQKEEKGKGVALGSLAMTAAMWFVRQQFGGPVGLAHFVLSKIRKPSPAGDSRPAQIPR